MKLFPWREVCDKAARLSREGALVFQQWNCQHCHAKQTMPDANHFYELGVCEECGKVTDIKMRGHNLMVVLSSDGDAVANILKRLGEFAK
jgi:hypothetical protein